MRFRLFANRFVEQVPKPIFFPGGGFKSKCGKRKSNKTELCESMEQKIPFAKLCHVAKGEVIEVLPCTVQWVRPFRLTSGESIQVEDIDVPEDATPFSDCTIAVSDGSDEEIEESVQYVFFYFF